MLVPWCSSAATVAARAAALQPRRTSFTALQTTQLAANHTSGCRDTCLLNLGPGRFSRPVAEGLASAPKVNLHVTDVTHKALDAGKQFAGGGRLAHAAPEMPGPPRRPDGLQTVANVVWIHTHYYQRDG